MPQALISGKYVTHRNFIIIFFYVFYIGKLRKHVRKTLFPKKEVLRQCEYKSDYKIGGCAGSSSLYVAVLKRKGRLCFLRIAFVGVVE